MKFSYDGNNEICYFPGPCRFIILLRELDTCVIEKDSFLSTNQVAKTTRTIGPWQLPILLQP